LADSQIALRGAVSLCAGVQDAEGLSMDLEMIQTEIRRLSIDLMRNELSVARRNHWRRKSVSAIRCS
jgi:hypothetical protein